MIRETESMQNREPREISVEGLTPVASGVHGTVYLKGRDNTASLSEARFRLRHLQ